MTERMARAFGRSTLRLVLLLAAVSIVSFILLANSPIDPIDAYFANKTASAEQHALVAAYWGFDRPPLDRFLLWGGHILHGDFGMSFIYRAPVLEVIGEKFRLTLLLMMTAWALSGIIGFIGMMVPNILASAVGGGRRRLIVLSAWLGGMMLLVLDSAARWIAFPVDLPVGIVIALLGGPLFMWLCLPSIHRQAG